MPSSSRYFVVRLDEPTHHALANLARRLSYEQGQQVSMGSLVARALREASWIRDGFSVKEADAEVERVADETAVRASMAQQLAEKSPAMMEGGGDDLDVEEE